MMSTTQYMVEQHVDDDDDSDVPPSEEDSLQTKFYPVMFELHTPSVSFVMFGHEHSPRPQGYTLADWRVSNSALRGEVPRDAVSRAIECSFLTAICDHPPD